jgi:membrane protease YdiL (CAAX protease family)
MNLVAALQNLIVFVIPVLIYAVVVRWRAKLRSSEITTRLGLVGGKHRPLLWALGACVPVAMVGAWASAQTKGFEGSMLAPFIEAPPSLFVFGSIFNYCVLATGFPEELLFRGLIAGVLFRRRSFWIANLIQALIFVLPHLLLLFVAPELWMLAVSLPLGLGLLLGWLRHTSGSIWPGVIVHAVSNAAGALMVLDWGA